MNQLRSDQEDHLEPKSTTGVIQPQELLDYVLRSESASTRKKLPKLRDMLTRETLKAALWEELQDPKAAGVDRRTAKTLDRIMTDSRWDEVISYTLKGCYFPKPLRVVGIKKKGGQGTRLLSIPAVLDRLIQRVLAKQVSRALDPYLLPGTIGYRHGKCLEDALLLCARYVRSGYKVLETDIEAFFDTVNRDRLMAYFRELSDEPELNRLVRRFLEAPRKKDGSETTPQTGIPQGSPLSPPLANLYLRPLDLALDQAGLNYVRYADDLVVFFQPRKEEATMALVNKKLRELGLSLKDAKTGIVDPTKGETFNFLGMVVHPDGEISHLKERVLDVVQLPEFKICAGGQWTVQGITSTLRSLAVDIERYLNFVPNLELPQSEVRPLLQHIVTDLSSALGAKGTLRC